MRAALRAVEPRGRAALVNVAACVKAPGGVASSTAPTRRLPGRPKARGLLALDDDGIDEAIGAVANKKLAVTGEPCL